MLLRGNLPLICTPMPLKKEAALMLPLLCKF
nr:MAG TPA: hypothetical protein [Caudoviricetes sp.]